MKVTVYAISLLVLIAETSHAALIDLTFSGNINSIRQATCTELDTSGPSPRCRAWTSEYLSNTRFYDNSLIELGDLFSGTSVLDTSQSPALSSDGYQATYLRATLSSELNIGSISLPNFHTPNSSIGGSVSVVDGRFGTDLLNVSKWYSGVEYFASFDLYLHDRDDIAFSNFEIPEVIDLNLFEVMNLDIAFVHRPSRNQLHIDANMNSFTYSKRPTKVSEPINTPIFILGIGFILFGRVFLSIASQRNLLPA
jgi:hypothetical protein